MAADVQERAQPAVALADDQDALRRLGQELPGGGIAPDRVTHNQWPSKIACCSRANTAGSVYHDPGSVGD